VNAGTVKAAPRLAEPDVKNRQFNSRIYLRGQSGRNLQPAGAAMFLLGIKY